MPGSVPVDEGGRSGSARTPPAGSGRWPSRTRDASRRFLLAAVDPDPTGFAALGAALAARLDWDWVIDRARAHKVAALLAARLGDLEHTIPLPGHVRKPLDTIRRQAREQALRAERTLQQVAQALGDRSVPFLVLKGSVLAEHVYGDPALRPFHDVDLVVPLPQLHDAEAALMSLGYRFYCPPPRAFGFVPLKARPTGPPDASVPEQLARHLYRSYHYHFGYLPSKGDDRLPVELHWHVANPSVLSVPPAVLWERATTTVVAGRTVQTLDIEATLVHVALHAMKDGPAMCRLLHLCDVAWLVARHAARDRCAGAIALAAAWRTHHHLARALETAGRLFRLPRSARPAPRGLVNVLLGSCLRLSGDPVGDGLRHGPLATLTRELLSETLWDLSLARLPRRAGRRVLATTRVRLSRWGVPPRPA